MRIFYCMTCFLVFAFLVIQFGGSGQPAYASPVPKTPTPECKKCNCFRYVEVGQWVSNENNGTDFLQYGSIDGNGDLVVGELNQAYEGYGNLTPGAQVCLELDPQFPPSEWVCSPHNIPTYPPSAPSPRVYFQRYDQGAFTICNTSGVGIAAGDWVQAKNLAMENGDIDDEAQLICSCEPR